MSLDVSVFNEEPSRPAMLHGKNFIKLGWSSSKFTPRRRDSLQHIAHAYGIGRCCIARNALGMSARLQGIELHATHVLVDFRPAQPSDHGRDAIFTAARR